MKKQLKKKIEKIVTNFLFTCDYVTREKVINELNEATKIEFKDLSTPEIIEMGLVCFRGYDPKTKKVIDLTINPTYNLINIEDCKI